MKRFQIIALSIATLVTVGVATGFTSKEEKETTCKAKAKVEETKPNQTISMFVTHGHCSTPFAGNIDRIQVITQPPEYKGNPLEDMKISFDVDPSSFNVCNSEELTDKLKTPGLFIGEKNEKMTFTSTNVYTMGLDWYQVNGILSIKGVEHEVKLFASGVRNPEDIRTSQLIIHGQLNLLDWGIDYDKIVNGKSDPVPTKWLYLNMAIDLC